jgi:hypothetical protein
MSVIWSWTYFHNLQWNKYLYFKGLLYIWEEMVMMALLHMAGLENSECIWKIQRKPEVAVSVSRECNDIIGSVKGSQISEKYWGEVWKGKRAHIYLEVRKKGEHIFFEWIKYLCVKVNRVDNSVGPTLSY